MKSRIAALLAGAALLGGCAVESGDNLGLGGLEQVSEVDERYISYNVEMVEVTGGRFWAPYGGPEGEVYRMRPPEDLSDETLRALARQLGPSYMRVSGTWANSTYLPADGEELTEPPEGYNQILTHEQWRGALDFADAVDAEIGISFAVSPGSRDENSVWLTDQAQRMLDLTRSAGGELTFAEFINEPNAASLGNLPEGYSSEDYTRDLGIFLEWANRETPDMLLVGPGGVGESRVDELPVSILGNILLTEGLMQRSPNTMDVVSYHFYGGVSQRCAGMSTVPSAAMDDALTTDWLDRTVEEYDYYAGLRDRFEAGDPLWVTETAQAACGGSPWAASYIDTFRFVNQLGLLAQRDVTVVFHNTLAASDYSLIEEETNVPRPNYWAAVLWNRLMGTTVLASPASPSENLRLYAHCLRDGSGGVGLAAINLGETEAVITPGNGAQVWQMSATALDSREVMINGASPRLGEDGELQGLDPVEADGELAIPAQSIAFIAAPNAGNATCE